MNLRLNLLSLALDVMDQFLSALVVLHHIQKSIQLAWNQLKIAKSLCI
jgi:hypothetical protein